MFLNFHSVHKILILFVFPCILFFSNDVNSGDEYSNNKVLMPFNMSDLHYRGAFRLPIKRLGDSRIAYSQGTFTLSSDYKSIFIVGHTHNQAIGQFSIPEIMNTNKIGNLQMAKVIQPFSKILERASTGNKQGVNRITGLESIGNQLILNGVEYYDADTNVRDTTLIIRNSRDLINSPVDGFFQLKGGAHAAGWISKVPSEWQQKLNTELLTGFASNYPINSRSSMGPAAFAFFPMSLLDSDEKSGFIFTEALLDYSLRFPLRKDRSNDEGTNHTWTDISSAKYGFIVPNTNSYLVIGNSGGHKSGVGYKITQDNGHTCGGPCARSHDDIYNYFWVWDVNDFVKVKQGAILPHELEPKNVGVFDEKRDSWIVAGADFDERNSLLYIMYSSKDDKQSIYEKAPLMLVYELSSK